MISIVATVSGFTWLILIVSGIISLLSFGEKVASVMERDDLKEWFKFGSMFGFIFGILSLIVTAFNLIGPHFNDVSGYQTQWDAVVIGLALGGALALKPIKDMKWASLGGLIGGIVVMILIWLIFPKTPDMLLIGAGVITLFVIFLALKFVEDFYLLIASLVTSPPLTVGLGVLGIVEGLLLLFNTSILNIFTHLT